MSQVAWSADYETSHAQMDDTHREFVDLLQGVEAALGGADADLLGKLDALHAHTVDHFGREDAWMAANGFAAENCHSMQHKQVLDVLVEVRRLFVDGGQRQYVEQLIPALMQWFSMHAQAADYGLAQILLHPEQLTAAPSASEAGEPALATGCGSGSCGH
ncbi:MAG: hypothetical protein RL722_2881 [Pseudomonadota bacterium]|jgi:hemerythrin-like metal-binding protein